MNSPTALSGRELTREIASALQKVNQQTIKKALKIAKIHPTGSSKTSLIQAFEEAVLRYGVGELISRMNRRLMKQTCKVLEIDNVRQKMLADAIHRIGLVEFLANKCDVMLLKEYYRILGLDDELKKAFWEKGSQEIEREIADEVMLQGTEHFFRRMPIDLVKEFCRELGIELQGSKVDPVDEILCHIFDLEPLETFSVILEQKRKQLEEKNRKREQQLPYSELMDIEFDKEEDVQEEQSESSGVAERTDIEKDESGEDHMVNVSEKMNTTTQQSESDNQTKSNKKSSNKRSPKSRSIHKSNKNKRNTEKSEASMKKDQTEESGTTTSQSEYEEKEEEVSAVSGPEDESDELPRRRGKAKHKAPPLSNIKKGISAEELHNMYNVTDLQEWCKQNNLDYTGKKPLIIKRIIQYLHTGQRPQKKTSKKGKKRGAGGVDIAKQDTATDDSTQGNNTNDFMEESETNLQS